VRRAEVFGSSKMIKNWLQTRSEIELHARAQRMVEKREKELGIWKPPTDTSSSSSNNTNNNNNNNNNSSNDSKHGNNSSLIRGNVHDAKFMAHQARAERELNAYSDNDGNANGNGHRRDTNGPHYDNEDLNALANDLVRTRSCDYHDCMLTMILSVLMYRRKLNQRQLPNQQSWNVRMLIV
jgi:hypothetical protein